MLAKAAGQLPAVLGTVVVLYGTVYCTMYNTQYTAEEYKIAAVSCAANANIVIVSKVLTSYNWGSLFTVKNILLIMINVKFYVVAEGVFIDSKISMCR